MRVPQAGAGAIAAPIDDVNWALLFGAWLIALTATPVALFSSEVMGPVPCLPCWSQRIAMFPLAVILAVALLPFDDRVVRYALPLALAGGALALYHTLLAWGFIPTGLVPCSQGVSCAEQPFRLPGFVTLPLLSLAAFSLITALLWVLRSRTLK